MGSLFLDIFKIGLDKALSNLFQLLKGTSGGLWPNPLLCTASVCSRGVGRRQEVLVCRVTRGPFLEGEGI